MGITENTASGQIELTLKQAGDLRDLHPETLIVDAVVLATGYIRDVHNEILKDCQFLNFSSDGTWVTERDYNVKLNRNLVEDDVQVYLQGCNETTHGLSDTLLSILANRGGEIVNSIFGPTFLEADTREFVEQTGKTSINGPLGPLWQHLHHQPADRLLSSTSGMRLASSAVKI